jgi:hypothetical protein
MYITSMALTRDAQLTVTVQPAVTLQQLAQQHGGMGLGKCSQLRHVSSSGVVYNCMGTQGLPAARGGGVITTSTAAVLVMGEATAPLLPCCVTAALLPCSVAAGLLLCCVNVVACLLLLLQRVDQVHGCFIRRLGGLFIQRRVGQTPVRIWVTARIHLQRCAHTCCGTVSRRAML